MRKIFPIILAGGKGERFWPVSRLRRPKQLLKLVSDRTLLEETLARIRPLAPREQTLVVTTQLLGPVIRELLPEYPVLEEPVGKNTAPAIAVAARWAALRDPDGLMVILPADHVIDPPQTFEEDVRFALRVAEKGYLVTFGVPPVRPETGYGYIEVGEVLMEEGECRAFRARGFKEKPDRKTAERYLREGRFFWNSGMFVWKVSAILEAFRQHMPEVWEGLQVLDPNSAESLERFYQEAPEISVDYGIMEKAQNIATIQARFFWEDLGSFRALERVIPKDSEGNFSKGPALTLDAQGNILFAERGFVAAIGVRDLVIVHTPDVTLVMPKEEAQRVKELLSVLRRNPEWTRRFWEEVD